MCTCLSRKKWAAGRQIEVGLASMFCVLFGLTACLYGMALVRVRTYPWWLSGLAVSGGASTMGAGVVMAYTGFSAITMAINMPGNLMLLIWICTVRVIMWRQGTVLMCIFQSLKFERAN